jgi:hypothetical protein
MRFMLVWEEGLAWCVDIGLFEFKVVIECPKSCTKPLRYTP